VGGAAHLAGKGIRSAADAISPAADLLGRSVERLEHEASRVPMVGGLLHGVLVLTEHALAGPYIISYQIARGKRIDRAVLGEFSRQLKAIHEVAPYAQMVISFVPGIGPGVSAGIAAGLALASGQRIDQVLVAAARGAVPGGAIAQMAFDMAHAAASGKRLEDVLATGAMDGLAVAGVPIPEEAKKGILAGLHAASKIARGERIDMALADTALEGLGAIPGMPPAAAKAISGGLKTGIALAHGEKLQHALVRAIPDAIGALADVGKSEVASSPTLRATEALLPSGTETAFHAAIGLMKHHSGPVELEAARGALDADEKKSFDLGLSVRIGEVTHTDTPPMSDRERAGYLIVKGMQGASEEQRVGMMAQLANDPDARRGAVIAVKEVANAREPWWFKVKEALGLAA